MYGREPLIATGEVTMVRFLVTVTLILIVVF